MGISYNIISYDNLLLGNVLDLLKNIDIRTGAEGAPVHY